tara:strand:+ start:2065 stop:3120 length:1056 start_codon:yes stop_codon:yes gene_type:complete
MKFFNPKEDVLDIELTPYGKRLLAKGKLRPAFYAFFDDGILYDGQLGGVSEDQNAAQERIKNDTPRLQTQAIFEGANTYSQTLTTALDAPYQHQTLKDSEHFLGIPLGESSLSGNVAPAWDLRFYHNEITGSQFAAGTIKYLTGSGGTLKIPQLDILVQPETYVSLESLIEENLNHLTDAYPNMEAGFTEDDEDAFAGASEQFDELDSRAGPYEDGTVVLVKQDGICIDAQEHNVDYLRENFDIEVFMIEQVRKEDGSILREDSKKLYFADLSVVSEGGVSPIPTPDSVEYWISLLVDKEIPESAYCEMKVPATTKKTPLDYVLGCGAEDVEKNITLRNFYSDTPVDEDIC